MTSKSSHKGFSVGFDSTPVDRLVPSWENAARDAAYEFCLSRPGLPALTIIKVRHPHWIGGPMTWRAKLVYTRSRHGNEYVQLRFLNRGKGVVDGEDAD